MILYPAIDLKGGACVRLVRGEMNTATVFNLAPEAQAKTFADEGFEYLHVVDLDGATSGHPVNDDAVRAILAAVDLPVQLGGGIRDRETIEHWLDRGVRRVILGTAALRDPDMVRQACSDFPGRIVIGIDARDGYAAIEGWAETSPVKALDLALRFDDAGAAAYVYTDISRDGAMRGPNIDATIDLAFAIVTPVIAAGGVSSMEDLRVLKQAEKAGIEGVICGRALYDGRIDPAAALRLLAGEGR